MPATVSYKSKRVSSAAGIPTYVRCVVCIFTLLRRLGGFGAGIDLINNCRTQVRLCRFDSICLRVCHRSTLHVVTMCTSE